MVAMELGRYLFCKGGKPVFIDIKGLAPNRLCFKAMDSEVAMVHVADSNGKLVEPPEELRMRTDGQVEPPPRTGAWYPTCLHDFAMLLHGKIVLQIVTEHAQVIKPPNDDSQTATRKRGRQSRWASRIEPCWHATKYHAVCKPEFNSACIMRSAKNPAAAVKGRKKPRSAAR